MFITQRALYCILSGLSLTLLSPASEAAVGSDCTLNGVPLYGKVKVVENFADFDVEVVSSFPDLKVQKVTSFPDRCGRWQFVTSFPDFTVRFVNSFPDLKIQYVSSFPGVR